MGNNNSRADKLTADDRGGANSEFVYRYQTVKKLKQSYVMLRKNISTVAMTMELTPQHLREVGTGYSNVCACLKHGSSGGANLRRQGQAEDGERAPNSHPRVDRELADESYQGFQTFCNAMDDVKTGACVTYRTTIHERITVELDRRLVSTKNALKQGSKTMRTMNRLTKAQKDVSQRERAAMRKGKDLSSSKSYSKAFEKRNAAESSYKAQLEAFDELYENVMAESQEFCASTTDIFLDCVVGYYREIISTIDFADTPESSRLRSCFSSRAKEVSVPDASGAMLCEMPVENKDGNRSLASTEPLKCD
ncbi:hypothetical protein, unknown function [Leishmania tarentolae]|uniref:BAR domain-containing protein n=1 Tax=Leishmania tarentolae TaxID=5689 RepID=A0A640KMU0_LEITA|nr:hypothetical protein, unknown function [Leishmania tarentolae]